MGRGRGLGRGGQMATGLGAAGRGGGCPARWLLLAGPVVSAWVAGWFRTALSGLRTRQRPHDWGEKPKGWLRQAAGRGEWRRFAVMRGSAALPRRGAGQNPRQERTSALPTAA